MRAMIPARVFAPWRPVWSGYPEVARLAEEADRLARVRRTGRSQPPEFEWAAQVVTARLALPNLLRDRSSMSAAQWYPLLRECLRRLEPAVAAARWPRWIELEIALAQASETGDLLLAALVLRTQIEEFALYRAILSLQAEFGHDDAEPTTSACESLVALAHLLDTVVLNRQAALTEEELARQPADARRTAGKSDRLSVVYDDLGDYVHPNYGSHALVLNPQSECAARIVCSSFIAVYVEFLSLPWASEAQLSSAPDNRRACRPSLDRLRLDAALGAILRAASGAERHALQSAKEGIEQAQGAAARQDEDVKLAARLGHVEGTTPLAELANALEDPGSPRDASRLLADDAYVSWPFPLFSPGMRSNWLSILSSAAQLSGRAATLPPIRTSEEPELGFEAWFDLALDALTLTINVGEFKIDALLVQALELLAQGSHLGAALAVRSVMEHHAAMIDTGDRVHRAWEQAKSKGRRPGAWETLQQLERFVARFLAGTMGTNEAQTSWRERWRELAGSYNVMGPIRSAKLDAPYSVLSRTLHGETYRGGDLIGPGSDEVQRSLSTKLLVFLGWLAKTETKMDRLAPAMWVASRLHGTSARSATDLQSLSVALASETLPGRMKRGRDVLGSGTEEDPFRFRAPLVYHEAFAAWCKQEGIPTDRRCAWFCSGQLGDRVEIGDGRFVFFRTSIEPS